MTLAVAAGAFGATEPDPIDWSDVDHVPPQGSRLFARYSAAELDALPDKFDWLARGLLAHPTYGQSGGESKTLKTHVTNIIGVGLAAGLPVFGRFHTPDARPWLAYSAEGGRVLFTRQLRRIAAAYGVAVRDLPIHVSFDVAPIPSPRFRASLSRDLADIQPGLTTIDPLYAYHGSDTKASNLHEEGSLLTSLSGACMDAGSSLLVVNHFNKTGAGNDLSRLTMTGGAEWSDSWLLLNHRTDPDVARGRFWLRLAVGSRQWGGTTWDLDLDIGAFDVDRGCHDGDITWELRAAASPAQREADHAAEIVHILEDEPWQHTREQLVKAVGGTATTVRQLIDILTQQGQITCRHVKQPEGKRLVGRLRYALATEPRLDDATQPTELPA